MSFIIDNDYKNKHRTMKSNHGKKYVKIVEVKDFP